MSEQEKGWGSLWIGLFAISTWVIFDPYTQFTIWSYRTDHHIRSENTHVEPKPHDCDFLQAPIGNKGCDYEMILKSIGQQLYVQWSKVNEGNDPRPKGEYFDANGIPAYWDGAKWIEHVNTGRQ